jgi:hypothetical protein
MYTFSVKQDRLIFEGVLKKINKKIQVEHSNEHDLEMPAKILDDLKSVLHD